MAITSLNKISDIASEFGVALHEAGDIKWYYDNKNSESPVQPVMNNGKIMDWIGYDHSYSDTIDLKKLYKFIDFSETHYKPSGVEESFSTYTTLAVNQGVGGQKSGEELQVVGKVRWPNAAEGRRFGVYLYPSNTVNTGMRFNIPANVSHITTNLKNFFIMFAVVSFSAMTSREHILGWNSYRNHPNANSIQSIDKYWAIWYGTNFAYLRKNDILTEPGEVIALNRPFLVMLFGNRDTSLDTCGYCVWDFGSATLTDFTPTYGNIWTPKSKYYSNVLGQILHNIGICNGDGKYMEGVYLRMVGYDGSGLVTDIPKLAESIYKQYWLYIN